MSPNSDPANENKQLGEPGYLSPRGQRTENAVGLIGIAVGIGCILIFAKPSTLWTIGVGVGAIFTWAIVTAIYRLIVYGRA